MLAQQAQAASQEPRTIATKRPADALSDVVQCLLRDKMLQLNAHQIHTLRRGGFSSFKVGTEAHVHVLLGTMRIFRKTMAS